MPFELTKKTSSVLVTLLKNTGLSPAVVSVPISYPPVLKMRGFPVPTPAAKLAHALTVKSGGKLKSAEFIVILELEFPAREAAPFASPKRSCTKLTMPRSPLFPFPLSSFALPFKGK